MNFTAAMKVLLGGGEVILNGVTYFLDEDHCTLINKGNDTIVPITVALLDATTYSVAGRTLGTDEVFAFFNTEKNRWVSTNEVAKHKAAGKRVAVFVLDELI